MGHHHNSHHHHHATAADGGVSQRVNSSRFSGPMTCRAHSFKHNNKKSSQKTHNTSSSANNGGSLNSHHEIIDLQLNSPRSESPVYGDGLESLGERRPVHKKQGKTPNDGRKSRKKMGLVAEFLGLKMEYNRN
ncbi:O-fucosyltransferase 35 [Forsythia ovata]|uniref:O-fucosyltransferase 35 n=1 Tax=Forsythia ovata TaxID=205694 RepID=A0ABD1TP28_9LAMI